MKLNELTAVAGATKEAKRIGRGHGSGQEMCIRDRVIPDLSPPGVSLRWVIRPASLTTRATSSS